MSINNIVCIEAELIKLMKERDRLARLIASAGKSAPRHWNRQLLEINKKISLLEKKIKKVPDEEDLFDLKLSEHDKKQLAEIRTSISETKSDFKKLIYIKGRLILSTVLLLFAGVYISHHLIMSQKGELSIPTDNKPNDLIDPNNFNSNVVSIDYPYFISCNKYFEIFICATSEKDMIIDIEIKPNSKKFKIKGDQWSKKINLHNKLREDWRPEIKYEPKGSFKLKYPEDISIIIKDNKGRILKNDKKITLKALRFNIPLSYISIALYGLYKLIKERFLNMILNLLIGKSDLIKTKKIDASE